MFVPAHQTVQQSLIRGCKFTLYSFRLSVDDNLPTFGPPQNQIFLILRQLIPGDIEIDPLEGPYLFIAQNVELLYAFYPDDDFAAHGGSGFCGAFRHLEADQVTDHEHFRELQGGLFAVFP